MLRENSYARTLSNKEYKSFWLKLHTSVFIEYFINRGSHVFVCFIDFSNAFDNVNYWKLLNKLLDDEVDINITHILAYWFFPSGGKCKVTLCLITTVCPRQWYTEIYLVDYN